MWPFKRKEEEKKESLMTAYLESYGEIVEKMYRIGGLPLTVFALAILLLFVSIWLSTTVAVMEKLFPYIILLACILAVIGIMIYLFEISWKKRMIQRSLDRFDDFIKIFFSKYLEGKEHIEAEHLEYGIRLLSRITGGDLQRMEESLKLLRNAENEQLSSK